jgi:oxygen-independent coproporphyrinogen-3 oxidase
MNPDKSAVSLEFDADLIRRLDVSGPRYTSYPTADRFVEAFDAHCYEYWAGKRNIGGKKRPLSLYFHIPFCNTLCFYCACNKIITKDHSKADTYLEYLTKEVRIQAKLFNQNDRVEQLHWGGGTPTFLSHDQIRSLMQVTREHFNLVDDRSGEYGIEIDPRKVDEATVALLREVGFNRMSMGIQDFDPAVQQAVNRIQTEEETARVIRAARDVGFKSISVDLIYGLPKQTTITFNQTLKKIIDLNPDRISVYNYAHLPKMFKPQRRINVEELPSPDTKLDILGLTIKRLNEAGYIYIGMDHFAKPDDELAVAQRVGRLHRNFQGYSTHADCDLVAMGVSAIGKIGPTFSQNYRTLEEYYDRLDMDQLPIMRGLELSQDDLLRQSIINTLMCHFELFMESLEMAYFINFETYFAREMIELRELEQAGLLEINDRVIQITPRGRLLIRNVCMVFDKYLRADKERQRYSRVI